MKRKVILAAGARPNFMKIAPIIRVIKKNNKSFNHLQFMIQKMFVHTGQHYNYEMSKIFFQDLDLYEPDIHLGVGSGTHTEQTGNVMVKFGRVLLKEKPDLVLVVGDVNSTLACALTSAKLHIPLAHVEAGLRSFDRTMPEEINRVLTDAIADYLFTPSIDADKNLKKEGINQAKIFLVGNVMVDSLLFNIKKAKESDILAKLGLINFKIKKSMPINNNIKSKPYALITLHRPSNVDDKNSFLKILSALNIIRKQIPIIFPIHPRTKKMIETFGLQKHFSYLKLNSSKSLASTNSINIIEPLGYLDFLNLEANAKFVLTDSGGIQEETTVLNIPCLTLRNSTERPITISQGTNILVRNDTERIISEAFKILEGKNRGGTCPELWDGKAAERIMNILNEKLGHVCKN